MKPAEVRVDFETISGRRPGRGLLHCTVEADVVVTGAGPAGLCAAIAAARAGRNTALITDRPVFGGSASSEVRVTPSGADHGCWNRYARETGIMEEMSLRLARRTQDGGRWRWLYYDELYFDMVAAEPNLQCFLNTSVCGADVDDTGRIRALKAVQLRSEKAYRFTGSMFIDCSGDGVVGYLAGADFRTGREAKSEFGETWAPEEADSGTMGATLLFSTVDRGHPVPFRAPDWALDVRELRTILDPDYALQRSFYRMPDGTFYGLWWAEYAGEDSVRDDDEVCRHTRRLIYGLWDYIKNSGRFDNVSRLEMDWIGHLPGKRESRRLTGPYVANANDFLEQRRFEDAIGFAGWPVDIHPPKGYRDPAPACTHDYLPGITDIPLRCLYSRNVPNLLFAGRDISVSHEGLGVLRVIATTAVMGQAAGTAASLALETGTDPDGVRREHMAELQRRLARGDQSIIGYRLLEDDDCSRRARVRASSEQPCRIEEGSHWLPLDQAAGLLLPVDQPRIDRIAFRLHAWRPSRVRLRVFSADRPQNYRLHREVASSSTDLKEGDQWVTFDVDAPPGDGLKLFFVFEANPAVMLRYDRTRLTGLLGLQFPEIEDGGGYDTEFVCRPFTPCFRAEPEPRLYAAGNVIDGHLRPHGLPHLWASRPFDVSDPAWLELDLKEARRLGRIELVFNPELNTHRQSIRGEYPVMESGMYPELIRDYDIVADVKGKPVTVVRERGNIGRFRVHTIEPVTAQSLRLVVYATWGCPRAEVFDFRAYG
ncbi:FAD-dependent oxidoreductase [Kiritimatiella glycovorans]|uniref:Putative FAD-binding dehydrogenase n=1 Tax=Kiritimatiella glycovorans TaxID=1307763 RepID=A0A0G3EE32_9BACT|nr:FAD-dependent oxidoreductase [Kiritimatiella glycovorans]AKJ64573.1 putative FAD-binding dehydrogenase [Kiritimatiella glycovorans]